MTKLTKTAPTEVLGKDTIEKEIIPHLSKGKRGFEPEVELYKIIQAIFYKLKTGCQWAMIPVKQFISDRDYSYQSIYHHYRKWSKDGSWENVWQAVLKKYKFLLDLSCIQIDGSHTPAKKGGEAVGYQGRKKSKTSNMIFLSDSLGNMLGFSEVMDGSHNDLFDIEKNMEQMFRHLKGAEVNVQDLFLNADAGFDSRELKDICFKLDLFPNIDLNKRRGKKDQMQDNEFVFDNKLYDKRFVIERANAWIDSFKTLLVRFTVKAQNWMSLHYMALSIRLLKRKV